MADGASGAGHREAGKDRVKVHVDLPRQDEDWPPVAVESVWAEPLGGDAYRLDNIPWFIRNLSSGDVIEARPDNDGTLRFVSRLKFSGNLTIRIIPFSNRPMEQSLKEVIDIFTTLGVEAEGAGPAYPILALSIPPAADYGAVLARLRAGAADGAWEYEEGCVNDAWLAL